MLGVMCQVAAENQSLIETIAGKHAKLARMRREFAIAIAMMTTRRQTSTKTLAKGSKEGATATQQSGPGALLMRSSGVPNTKSHAQPVFVMA